MKTASDHFAAPFFSSHGAADAPFDGSVLGRIGDDLRHHFDDSLEMDLPSRLLELAAAIDARRMGEPRDE